MRFLIEQMAGDGHWFIRGSDRYEHDAKYHAEQYAQADHVYIRVTDALTRAVVFTRDERRMPPGV